MEGLLWEMYIRLNSGVLICPVFTIKIQNQRRWCENIFFPGAFDIEKMILVFPENQILFCQNIKLLFL